MTDNAREERPDAPRDPAETASTPEDGQHSDKPRGRRRLTRPFRAFLILLLLLLLGTVVAYALYSQWIANPENVRSLAVRNLAPLFPGKDVTIGVASFSILGGLHLYDVKVSDPRTQAQIAKLDHAHVEFDLGRLARLSLAPRNAVFAGLFLDVTRHEDGTWNLPVPEVRPEDPEAEPPLALPFTLRLDGAFVSFEDDMLGYSLSLPVDSLTLMSDSEGLSFWRLAATFGGGALGKWRISAKGDIEAGTFEAYFAVAALELAGLENRIPPRGRSAYHTFQPAGPVDLTGKVSLGGDAGLSFQTVAALKGVSLVYDQFPLPAHNAVGSMTFDDKGFALLDVACDAGGGRLVLSGTGGYGADASYNITAEAEGVAIGEQLLSALPPPSDREIRKFRPSGEIDATVRVVRAYGPHMPVDVTVDLMLHDAYVAYEDFPLPLSDVNGRILYMDGEVTVDDVTGRRGDARVAVSGSVSGDEAGPRIDLRILAEGLALDEELRRIMPQDAAEVWRSLALAGRGDLEATVSRRPGTDIDVDFVMALRDASARYERVPYLFVDGKGELVFRGGILYLNDIALRHGDSTVMVAGRADTATGEVAVDFQIDDVSLDEEAMAALPEEVSAHFARLGLTGTADAWLSVRRDAAGEVTLEDVRAQFADASFLEPSLPMGVGAASGTVAYAGNALIIDRLDGRLFAGNAAALMPAARLAAAFPAPAVTLTGRIPLDEEREGWSFQFDVSGLMIDEALLRGLPEGLADALSGYDISGHADISGSISRMVATAPLPEEASPSRLSTGESIDYSVVVRSHGMALEAGRKVDGMVGEVAIEGRWAEHNGTFEARGALDEVALAGRQMGQTRFGLQKTDEEVRLDSFTTAMLGGTLSGRGRISTTDGGRYGFSADFRALDLARLLESAFGYRREGLAGRLSGNIELLSPTGEYRDILASGEASITDGTLWEVPFVFVMLNILNLRLPDQSQFDRAHVRLRFAQDRLLIEEFSMSSDPATLLGRGVIGLDGSLDLTFYAQPGRIPIISLLAGEVGRNIVRAQVTGTFAEPRVALIPSGVLGGVVDWIRRPLERLGRQ